MRNSFKLLYAVNVVKKDIPRLSGDIRLRVKKTIETKLTHAPIEFGEPLRHSLKRRWKLRVGDYRVIYEIFGDTVHILCIGHRREIYKYFRDE